MPAYVLPLVVLVVAILLGVVLARLWRVRELAPALTVALLTLSIGGALLLAVWPPRLGWDLDGGEILLYSFQPPAADATPEGAPRLEEKLLATVARRINPGAVKEMTIRQRGAGQLEIVVPNAGSSDIEHLKRIISRVGLLDLRVLANQRDDKLLVEQAQAEKGSEVRGESGQVLGWWVPVAPNQEAVLRAYPELVTRSASRDGQPALEVLVVNGEQHATDAQIVRAIPVLDVQNKPAVRLVFNAAGSQAVRALTGAKLPDQVGSFTRKLGVSLDGQLASVSVIKEVTLDGQISNAFTEPEAREWCEVLNAGALPLKLSAEPIQQLRSGPGAGPEGVTPLLVAGAVGLALVLLLMAVVYRLAGVVAGVLMLANLALVVAVEAAVHIALTLSTVAGFVLVVALSVGTSALLFERIREEQERQTALRMALRNGYAKVLGGVLDSTGALVLVASILVLMGTVVFKAFAVTVWLGAVFSLLTNLYCMRVFLDLAERRRWISKLSTLRLPRPANADYLSKAWIAGSLSALAVLAALVVVGLRAADLPDVDLAGGVTTQLVFKESQEIAAVRAGVATLPGATVFDVRQGDEAPGRRFLVNSPLPADQTAEAYLPQLQATLRTAFADRLAAEPGTGPDAASAIGSRVAAAMRDQAGYGVLFGIVTLFGLLWIRFRWVQYGLVALMVLGHDALITLGLIAASQWLAPYLGLLRIDAFRLTLPVIAAVAAVLGYSLTSAIVFFDRVREARSKGTHLLPDKVNAALAQTLGRTRLSALALLLMALALYLAGGPGIHAAAFTLVVGVLVSSYSARWLTAPLLFWLSRPPAQTAVPVKAAPSKQRTR